MVDRHEWVAGAMVHGPGTYQTRVKAEEFASGTYLYRIVMDDFVMTREMTVVH